MQASLGLSSGHATGTSMSPTADFSYPPEQDDWLRIREPVRVLYVTQDRSLKEVHSILRARYGFRASERMIKARLKDWGYQKNAKREDWQFLCRLDHNTRQQGGTTSVYLIRGHQKSVKDLQRFIRNQGMTPEQFLAEAVRDTSGRPIPSYISALESDSGQSGLAHSQIPLTRASSTSMCDDADSQTLQQSLTDISGSVASDGTASCNASFDTSSSLSVMTKKRRRASPEDVSTLVSPSSYTTTTTSPACLQIQWEFEACASQLLQAQPLRSRMGEDDIQSWTLLNANPLGGRERQNFEFLCSRCNQSSNAHFVSLDGFEPRSDAQRSILNDSTERTWHLPVSTKEEGSWLWVSRCFLACMYLTKGNERFAEMSLRQAAHEFERLLVSRDPSLLTAASLTITVLHMHDQGRIAHRIMQSAESVTDRTLPVKDPIRTTIAFLAASADAENEELNRSGLTSGHLKAALQTFSETLPLTHPYVIAAEHNLSWMLKWEGNYLEGEHHARSVYQRSCEVFKAIHMQSITSLAILAGCLAQQGQREDECVTMYERVIGGAEQVLGKSHPYTLEAKRRLATILKPFAERRLEVLQLYKDVVWGRVKILGRQHQYTRGAANDYETQLRELNIWTDTEGNSSSQRIELERLLEQNNSGSSIQVNSTLTTADGVSSYDSQQLQLRDGQVKVAAIKPTNDDNDNDVDDVLHDRPSLTNSNEYAGY